MKKTIIAVSTVICVISFVALLVLMGVQVLPDMQKGGPIAVYGEPYSQQWDLTASDNMDFHVDVNRIDVVVQPYSGDTVRVNFDGHRITSHENMMPHMLVEQFGSSITIQEKYGEMKNRFAYFSFDMNGTMSGTLTIDLPQKQWNTFDVSNFSGAVDVTDIACDTFNAGATSGYVTLRNINSAGNLTATSFSGNIHLESASAAQLLNLSNSSGLIRCDNLTAHRLQADTFSGDAVFAKVDLLEDADISTTSGFIEVDTFTAKKLRTNSFSGSANLQNISAEKIDASTTSGDIKGRTSIPCDIKSNTFSGGVYWNLPEDMGFTLTASTFSGSVECRKQMLQSLNGSYLIGDGSHTVEISTTSGGIVVD